MPVRADLKQNVLAEHLVCNGWSDTDFDLPGEFAVWYFVYASGTLTSEQNNEPWL